MKKRTIAILLAALLAVTTTACGSESYVANDAADIVGESTEEITEEDTTKESAIGESSVEETIAESTEESTENTVDASTEESAEEETETAPEETPAPAQPTAAPQAAAEPARTSEPVTVAAASSATESTPAWSAPIGTQVIGITSNLDTGEMGPGVGEEIFIADGGKGFDTNPVPAAPAQPAAPVPVITPVEPAPAPVPVVTPVEPVHVHVWTPVYEDVYVEPWETVISEETITEEEMVHICYCMVCGWESPDGHVDLSHVASCWTWVTSEDYVDMAGNPIGQRVKFGPDGVYEAYRGMTSKDEMRPVTRINRVVEYGGGYENHQTSRVCTTCGATEAVDWQPEVWIRHELGVTQ